MKNLVTKTAINFIKQTKNRKSFDSITELLKSKYCTVTFFTESARMELLRKYGLPRTFQNKDAFTVIDDDMTLIYIKSDASPEDKLYLLLHEVGHIELNHLEMSTLTCSSRLHDIEADAFAYTVLNPPKVNIRLTVTVLILTAFLGFCLGTHTVPQETPVSTSVYQTEQVEEIEYVYITPTGRKYHEENCMYVKNKNCTKLIIEEAQKNYEPCSVCNP